MQHIVPCICILPYVLDLRAPRVVYRLRFQSFNTETDSLKKSMFDPNTDSDSDPFQDLLRTASYKERPNYMMLKYVGSPKDTDFGSRFLANPRTYQAVLHHAYYAPPHVETRGGKIRKFKEKRATY